MTSDADAPDSPFAGAGWPLDRLEPVRRIGRGGQAEVWEARDDRGDPCAVKIFLDASPEQAVREARAVSGLLAHTHLVAVRDHHPGSEDGPPHVVMELVPGEDLEARVRREGGLGVDEACAIGEQVLSGLAHLHEGGVVHGDLKPSNVLVTPDGVVKIGDVGYGRPRDREGLRSSLAPSMVVDRPRLEEAERHAASLAYLAPEVREGDPPGPAADQYAFGLLLHETLTGELRPAFRRSLREHGLRGAELLDDIIGRATAADPDARFPDVGAMRRALGAARRGLPPEAADPGLSEDSPLRATVLDLLGRDLAIPDDLWDATVAAGRRLAPDLDEVERLVAEAGAEASTPGYGLCVSALLATVPVEDPPGSCRLSFRHLREPVAFVAAWNPGHEVEVRGTMTFFADGMRGGTARLEGRAEHAARGLEGGTVRVVGPVRQLAEGMRAGEVVVEGDVGTVGPRVEGGRIVVRGDVREVIGLEGGTLRVSGRVERADPGSRRRIEGGTVPPDEDAADESAGGDAPTGS